MARNRVIVDTDPVRFVPRYLFTAKSRDQGTDDILALLYALSCSPNDLEVLLISVTFGNVNVQKYDTLVSGLYCTVLFTFNLAVFVMSFPCFMSLRKR